MVPICICPLKDTIHWPDFLRFTVRNKLIDGMLTMLLSADRFGPVRQTMPV
jgi:hypothetical protein